MFWNVLMHLLIGLFGASWFMLTPKGIGLALILAFATQLSDVFRLRMDLRRTLEHQLKGGEKLVKERNKGKKKKKRQQAPVVTSEAEITAKMEAFNKGIPFLLAKNIAIFAGLILISSFISRTINYGVGL